MEGGLIGLIILSGLLVIGGSIRGVKPEDAALELSIRVACAGDLLTMDIVASGIVLIVDCPINVALVCAAGFTLVIRAFRASSSCCSLRMSASAAAPVKGMGWY